MSWIPSLPIFNKKPKRYKYVFSGFSANLEHTYKEIVRDGGEVLRLDTYLLRGVDHYLLTVITNIDYHGNGQEYKP